LRGMIGDSSGTKRNWSASGTGVELTAACVRDPLAGDRGVNRSGYASMALSYARIGYGPPQMTSFRLVAVAACKWSINDRAIDLGSPVALSAVLLPVSVSLVPADGDLHPGASHTCEPVFVPVGIRPTRSFLAALSI